MLSVGAAVIVSGSTCPHEWPVAPLPVWACGFTLQPLPSPVPCTCPHMGHKEGSGVRDLVVKGLKGGTPLTVTGHEGGGALRPW